VTGPSWLAGILAVIMIATAAYCASRLVIARAHRRTGGRDVDAVHAVMGVAMAGMLVSWLNPLPDRVWAVMFGAATGWFGWQAWRGRRAGPAPAVAPGAARSPHRHHLPHLVMCGAMVYMLLAAQPGKPGPGIAMGAAAASGRFPLLALVLAVFMVGYVMWQADRLPAVARAGATGTGATGTGASRPDPGVTLAPGRGAAPGDVPVLLAAGPAPGLAPSPGPGARSPRLTACCQIAMGVTMGYLLILML
jgi:hypothetical protein